MKFKKFDVIVIGGGAAGLVASKLVRGLGKTVAIIEAEKMGGECTWTGCVPSKTLIHQARIAYETKQAQRFGLHTLQPIEFNTDNAMTHVRATVERIYQTHTPERLQEIGIKIFIGRPQFIDPYTIELDDMRLIAKKFIIATGSSPLIPPIEGIDSIPFYTNETIFNLEKIPNSMTIIGAGAIGIEMASAFNRLGTKVTIIDHGERILINEEKELVNLLMQQLVQEGIILHSSSTVNKVYSDNFIIGLEFNNDGENKTVLSEILLIATGRRPNIEGLKLDNAGVQRTKNGIKVNKQMLTNVSHIYSCGDVNNEPYKFSHIAEHEAIIAAYNACTPIFKRRADYSSFPWITFCAPELAHLGLTEAQARQEYGNAVRIYRAEYNQIDRPVIDGNEVGLVKVICDKRGYILGAHILGERAGEMIHELTLCKRKKIKFSKLNDMIHAYPTYCDVIKKAARLAYIDKIKRNFFVRILQKFRSKN